MLRVQKHLRNTFLAGIFAAIPLAVTAFIIWWIDNKTRAISLWVFHRDIPFVGVALALAVIYASGLVATSLLGKLLLRVIDSLILRLPVLRPLYLGWKQIALTPGGTEGIFSKVALVPDETGTALLLGFTSGRPIDGDADTMCVFVPTAPNPVNGRLFFVRREKCQMVNISTEEAFKVILSTGNYTPLELGVASAGLTSRLAKPGA